MKTGFTAAALAGILLGTVPRENVFEARPLGVQMSIKMVGPSMQAADLQIICLFKNEESPTN